jgi:hypothetical protein
MAAEARAHARQLVACGELEALDRAVTALACHLARQMLGVIELQVRRRQHQTLDAIAVTRAIAQMTEAALREQLAGIGGHSSAIRVIAAVAAVAAGGRWQQAIGAVPAALRAVVTSRARDVQLEHVAPVVEAYREALVREDHRARPAITRQRSGRAIALWHGSAARHFRQAVHRA